MRNAYKNESLGISKEDFEAPEVVSIPINCDEIPIEDPLQPKEESLEDLGF